MPKLKGQSDALNYARSISSMPHNLGSHPGRGTKMRGQMMKGMKMNGRNNYSMSMKKKAMKGQS